MINRPFAPLISFAAITNLITTANAETIISEKFSGKDSADLVGTATPDGNTWTGAAGEISRPKGAGGEFENAPVLKYSVKQDGSTGGVAFTAYHKFTLKPGRVYTLEGRISPTNKADNQWFTIGFCVTAQDGNTAPHQDGGTTYGQTVLSGSGYRYGWTGPDTRDICKLQGPGLHSGTVKVVLDTSRLDNYSIELFDGAGKSIHGPESIGTPAISQIFIGSSGTDGVFESLTLVDDSPNEKTEPRTKE